MGLTYGKDARFSSRSFHLRPGCRGYSACGCASDATAAAARRIAVIIENDNLGTIEPALLQAKDMS